MRFPASPFATKPSGPKSSEAIAGAILSRRLQRGLSGTPYGDGNAAHRIAEAIANLKTIQSGEIPFTSLS